jgi:hypothetical protein
MVTVDHADDRTAVRRTVPAYVTRRGGLRLSDEDHARTHQTRLVGQHHRLLLSRGRASSLTLSARAISAFNIADHLHEHLEHRTLARLIGGYFFTRPTLTRCSTTPACGTTSSGALREGLTLQKTATRKAAADKQLVADAYDECQRKRAPKFRLRHWGAGWYPRRGGETRTPTHPDTFVELGKCGRGAGCSRWPDTSQNCSPRGRLAIAADLPIYDGQV